MTANASLADREAAWRRHERPWAKRSTAPGALPARSSRQERRRARRQRQRTRANWSRRGAISSGVSAAAGLIVQVLRRFVPDIQDLFAQLERQLGEAMSVAAPRPCIPSRAALPPLAPAPRRPCQRAGAGPAPRRSAARHGNPRRHPPRRTAHPVRCLPAPPAGDVRRRAGGVGELNSGAVASPARFRRPGARLHPLRPVANNAMGVIRRYS